MPDSFRQLILCPENPEFALESSELVDVLAKLGLVGEAIGTTKDQRFYVGQSFLQHISFMGCAPAVEFMPPDGKPVNSSTDWDRFTFIFLPEPFITSKWVGDLQMARPVCPQCGKRISKPGEHVDTHIASLRCPHCHSQSPVCKFDWREFGGCARTMVSIVNVYPKEVIPSSNLLNQLAALTKVAWRYFYINGLLPA